MCVAATAIVLTGSLLERAAAGHVEELPDDVSRTG